MTTTHVGQAGWRVQRARAPRLRLALAFCTAPESSRFLAQPCAEGLGEQRASLLLGGVLDRAGGGI